jgi:uncharacterized protein
MANISKAIVNPYYGREIPDAEALGLVPDRIYCLLRDPRELAQAASSFTGKPLVLVHRPQLADDHSREITVGAVGEAIFEAPNLKAPLVVWDGAGIAAIESGEQRELSCGYFYRAEMTPGEYEGEKYDGRIVDIVGNHVALVENGRAGPDVLVGDSSPFPKPPEKTAMAKTPALSRKALLASGAIRAYLAPKLAADAKIDVAPLVAGVTAKNWAVQKPKLKTALDKALAGKLAQDADISGLALALDAVDDEGDEIAEDEEEEEDKEKKVAEDEDESKPEPGVSKAAMDAAISTAVTKAAREAETATVARMLAIRETEKAVRPYVGQIEVAMDSAAAVYKLALDHLNVDVAGVPESAYGAVLKAIPAPNAAPAPASPWMATPRPPSPSGFPPPAVSSPSRKEGRP